jgi:hypothetical protein
MEMRPKFLSTLSSLEVRSGSSLKSLTSPLLHTIGAINARLGGHQAGISRVPNEAERFT